MALTQQEIDWANQRYGGEAGIWLMTLFGPERPGGLRFARNTEDVTSRGLVYAKSWFEFSRPTDGDDQSFASVSVPNVDREIGLILLEGSHGLTANFELVRPSDYDKVVESHRMLKVRVATINALSVELRLSSARLDEEPYGWVRVSPALFPGLWRL
jgi:hypothetical protein